MDDSRGWGTLPERKKSSGMMMFLMATLIGFCAGLTPGIFKVRQLRSDLAVTVQETTKEITELRQNVLGEKQMTEECNRVVLGDGAKTILMDRNHPYGQYVPPGTQLPAGYIPGPVWIVNRRIVPHTMDGTLNGIYAYQRPDGSVDGWYLTGGLR